MASSKIIHVVVWLYYVSLLKHLIDHVGFHNVLLQYNNLEIGMYKSRVSLAIWFKYAFKV